MDLRLATLKQSLSICRTMFQHRKPLCIDSVLKHCAAFLALLGAPYIYEISSLRVNIIKWQVKFNPVA